MVKEQNYFGIAKYVKIAFIAKIRVFQKCCCPGAWEHSRKFQK